MPELMELEHIIRIRVAQAIHQIAIVAQRVVVEPFEHRDERERRDDGIEIGRGGLGDAVGEETREAGENVGAAARVAERVATASFCRAIVRAPSRAAADNEICQL